MKEVKLNLELTGESLKDIFMSLINLDPSNDFDHGNDYKTIFTPEGEICLLDGSVVMKYKATYTDGGISETVLDSQTFSTACYEAKPLDIQNIPIENVQTEIDSVYINMSKKVHFEEIEFNGISNVEELWKERVIAFEFDPHVVQLSKKAYVCAVCDQTIPAQSSYVTEECLMQMYSPKAKNFYNWKGCRRRHIDCKNGIVSIELEQANNEYSCDYCHQPIPKDSYYIKEEYMISSILPILKRHVSCHTPVG